MKDTTLIILCAGDSTRFELHCKKQWLRISDEPLWLNVTNKLFHYSDFKEAILVAHKNEITYMKNFTNQFTFVVGGITRQESMKNALQNVTTPYVMISDVARCCIEKDTVENLLKNKEKASCIVPYIKVSDTVVCEGQTIQRDDVKLIQTPQLSKTAILKKALETSKEFTDDSSAIKNIGESIHYIQGSPKAEKLTYIKDIQNLTCLKPPSKDTFTGFGIDIHPFEDNKQMVLGGVYIESDVGFKAHSDGDVLIHSIIDALLGAAGAGDIGEFFPDNDAQYKDADSKELLRDIVKFIHNVGYNIVNVDTSILAQIPRINPHKEKIKESLSTLLSIPYHKVNIKATTAEKMGFVGRKEGVTVYSVATLKYYDWTEQ